MSFMVEMGDTSLAGVSHRWSPANEKTGGYGTLRFGTAARGVKVYLHTPAEIDEVIAELVAMRAEMDPPAPGCDCMADPEPAVTADPPHHMTGDTPGLDCLAEDGGYICNAQDGHDGPDHVAYGSEGTECRRWPVAADATRDQPASPDAAEALYDAIVAGTPVQVTE